MDWDIAEKEATTADPQRKKLLITDEYFQRVTQALIMRLRQHEEAAIQDGKYCNSPTYVLELFVNQICLTN